MIEKSIVENMLNEESYLKELYNVFEMINNLVDSNFSDNKELLKKLEDNVYTVKGKTLSNQERLALEIKKIIKTNENNDDSKSKEIISKRLQNILDIMDELFDKNIDKNYIMDVYREKYDNVINNTIFEMKKKISILESELNIPISFFEAATYAFLDLYKKYRNSYNKTNVFIKEMGDKYEYI